MKQKKAECNSPGPMTDRSLIVIVKVIVVVMVMVIERVIVMVNSK